MARRLYFRASAAAAVSPTFDAGWESTTSAVSRVLARTTLAGDTLATDTSKTSTAGQDRLHRQYVSDPLAAGLVFDTSVTYKCYVQVLESNADDNIRSRLGVSVVSRDGTTVRVTALAIADYSSGAEWNTALRNKAFADGDAGAGSYTTVAGDRLVVEIGHSDSAGTTIGGSSRWGSEATSVTDTPENETSTSTTVRPWFETSLDLVFEADLTQATETDTAQAVTRAPFTSVTQATETDAAQAVAWVHRRLAAKALEFDRAKQLASSGGVLPPSGFPVLIRAPGRAGRIHHEIVAKSGEVYHPNMADWQALEEAPGGFGPATGLISERIFRAHRDIFREGSVWRTYTEDGLCIHAGTLMEPDAAGAEVQLADRGVAWRANREIGPVLYQRAIGQELAITYVDPGAWSTSFPIQSHTNVDTGILFTREDTGDTAVGNADMPVIIPLLGRELSHLKFHLEGSKARIIVYAARMVRSASIANSSELDITSADEVWFANLTPTTALDEGEVEIDLTKLSDGLTAPSAALNNYASTGLGQVYPDSIIISVGNDPYGTGANNANLTEVVVSNIEVNGSPVGERNHFSAGDLVRDIAQRLGFGAIAVQGGGIDILPYELPPGVPASEALDYACLLTDKRYRILDNGSRIAFDFGPWNDKTWSLASPWSPLDVVPEERFDAVAVPFTYPGTHGQLDDQVIVRTENSPLERRNVYWGLALSEPAHNGDQARHLAGMYADVLVRRRFSGTFQAAEILGPDGEKRSAHHVNAGDTLDPVRQYEPGRLRIGRLTRFDDHVEGEFDGQMGVLNKMLARREKRLSRR